MSVILQQQITSDRSVNNAAEPEALGIDHIELYVGNAFQAAHFYSTTFGLKPVLYAGPETGAADRASYVVRRGRINLVLTSPIQNGSGIAEALAEHGEGVRDVAFAVKDVEEAFNRAIARGAKPVSEPLAITRGDATCLRAKIATFGNTIHSLVEQRPTGEALFPDYEAIEWSAPVAPTTVNTIDHIAVSVGSGQIDRWVSFYQDVFGFKQSYEEVTSTDSSGMNSKVVENKSGSIKVVFVEPVQGRRKSPIQEFLTFNRGAGVHHLALACDNIIDNIRTMRSSGVRFMKTPKTYYEMLSPRVGTVDESLEALSDSGVLVDRDGGGYLLQIFTLPLQARPTFSIEIIERKAAKGFGSGNIKALFEAIEREQLLRGHA
ncbi:MAG TPA: 4-hydroxyphenylpyruvate dioxygenase [Bryobacteraceae bacterium]|nr:4-hydroxyphenylpyruvate dioxygenase [Bryobacteraceae bacterium]